MPMETSERHYLKTFCRNQASGGLHRLRLWFERKFAILSLDTAMHVTNRRLVATRVPFAELRETPVELQQSDGYFHTLTEIWQQPELWAETARRTISTRSHWGEIVTSAQAIVLTGSGSSFFVGKCIAGALQESTSIPVTTVESGEILMLGADALARPRDRCSLFRFRVPETVPRAQDWFNTACNEEPEINHLLDLLQPEWTSRSKVGSRRLRIGIRGSTC